MRIALTAISLLLAATAVQAQSKRLPESTQQHYLQQYGPNWEEIVQKYGDKPERLLEAATAYRQSLERPSFFFDNVSEVSPYVLREEAEPNDYFDTADDLDDVLSTPGWRGDEFHGGLVKATFTVGDYDVYKFTVDTGKMYYFGSTHSYLGDVPTDEGSFAVSAKIFHESDLDTTYVTGFGGIEGNDQIRGDITGRLSDGRSNSGDFRLTGWTAPVVPGTGEPLEGVYYLFLYNGPTSGTPAPIKSLEREGTYHLAAYAVDLDPYVSKAEPNQTFAEAIENFEAVLPSDAVVRTFMAYNPDTVRVAATGGLAGAPFIPTQGNSVYPQLLEQGSEDMDWFRVDAKANHTLIVETMPWFGWYRHPDGRIGPGNPRFSDTILELYDSDATVRLVEDDDGAREQQSVNGDPNNINSRIVYQVTEDAPLWVRQTPWASTTRSTDQSVDNRDPGRYIYYIWTHQYTNDLIEANSEPNGTAATAMHIAARTDTVITGSFADSGDEDYFRVFMHEQRMYTIGVSDAAAGIELYHEYEADKGAGTVAMTDELLQGAGVVTSSGKVVAGYVPEQTGAYLIKLSGGSGAYRLAVIDKGEAFHLWRTNEPDDVAEAALTQAALQIGPGAAARSAVIYPSGDVDHYHFTATAGTELNISLSGSHAELADDNVFEMTLIGPDGTEIATNAANITRVATSSGTYIVRVKAADGMAVGAYRLSGGEAIAEKEPNNTFATATLFRPGIGNYEASLSVGDVDYYRMRLEVGKLYSFRSYDNETGAALTVEFMDEVDGTSILDASNWVANYSGSNFKIANIMPRETKDYYLKVSGSGGKYKVGARVNENFLALKDKGEPNNSKADADAMGPYQAFGLDVEYALFEQNHPRFFGDLDWFRIEVAAGQTLVAETKPVGGDDWARDTDTKLFLYDAAGATELKNDDDDGNDWYSKFEWPAVEDGVVYLVVGTSRSAESGDDRSLARGDYLLNVTLSSAEVEPNNTAAQADDNVLPLGWIDAAFDDEDLVDVYRLNLKADHIYHIRTVKPEEGYAANFTAQVWSADNPGVNLLSNEATGYNTRYNSSNVKVNFIPDADGAYYLSLQGTAAGAYQVGMKGREISELKAKGEPNNSIAEADAIGTQEFDNPGESMLSMLYNADFPFTEGMQITAKYSDDRDFYKYELAAGDTLVAETKPADGSLWQRDYDGYMELWDASGTMVADDDDGGEDWHSKITFVAPAEGAYYVVIRSQDYIDCWDGGSCDRDPARGEYRLNVQKLDGSPVAIPTEKDTPAEYRLEANYPNPFNPSTTITYALPSATKVSLTIYNALGQQVATLVNADMAAGTHTVSFDASHLSSGLYMYRIQAGDFVQVRKMLLVK